MVRVRGGAGELAFELVAEFFQRGVKDEADIADTEAGDFGNLLVGAVVLKFEFEDFLLIGSERLDQFPDTVREVLNVGMVTGFLLLGGDQREGGFVAKVEALLFAEDVESAIPTDGVEPGFDVFLDFGVIGDPQFEESVLDDITGSLSITIEDAGGVADERAFLIFERTLDQLVGFVGITLV